MKKIEITKFIGSAPYILGIKLEEIMKSLPGDSKVLEARKGKRVIDGCVSMKFVNDELNEFSILEDCDVIFEGRNVFSDDFVNELKKKYKPVNKFGFTIFDEIGIALSDVETKDQKKAVTVYKKGGWDEVLKLPG